MKYRKIQILNEVQTIMATITKRNNGYRIRVSCGYDSENRQIIKSMTWTPPPKMTKKQIEKELERQAVLFEEKCRTGQFLDSTVTLAEFSERWFKDYAEKGLKAQSITGYKSLMPRIIKALGHIRLCNLRPNHLLEFYNNLAEKGVRDDTKYKAVDDFKQILKNANMTQTELSKKSGVSVTTIRTCVKGNNVSKETAAKLAEALNRSNLFTPAEGQDKLSNSTIAKYHRLLSSMLTAAVRWQVIPSNPCSRVEPPKYQYEEAAALDEDGVAQLIDCLNNEPIKYRAAVMLILYTGLRRGELCGLNWDDVDMVNGIVNITKELLYTPARGLYEDTPKTKQSNRAVSIPPDMIKLLKEYERKQAAERLKMGDLWKGSGKLFVTNNGEPLRPDSFSAWFKKFVRRNNLPDIHVHSLRHTSSTLLIASGVNIATVSSRLGHANKTTTLNIYTHAIKSADKQAAEQLQNIFHSSANHQKAL